MFIYWKPKRICLFVCLFVAAPVRELGEALTWARLHTWPNGIGELEGANLQPHAILVQDIHQHKLKALLCPCNGRLATA